MELLEDGLIAFFCAVGITTIVWMIAGAVFQIGKPFIPQLRLVLPVSGDAPALEDDMRELCRSRRGLRGASIVVEDLGLSPQARELAEFLCAREDSAVVLKPQEMYQTKEDMDGRVELV